MKKRKKKLRKMISLKKIKKMRNKRKTKKIRKIRTKAMARTRIKKLLLKLQCLQKQLRRKQANKNYFSQIVLEMQYFARLLTV